MRQVLWRIYQGSPALKRSAWQLYQWSIGLQPRHEKAYATHIPILAALSVVAGPKRITEFGAGDYSTALFLDRSVFPKLETLVSLENDAAWYERVREKMGADSRLDLRNIQGELCHVVTQQLLTTDIVFVDDSAFHVRNRTIAAVGKLAPAGVPVVVHDAEYVRTRMVIRHAFDHYFVFRAFHPQTAVAWNGELRFGSELRDIARRIAENAPRISPSNGEEWRATLSGSQNTSSASPK